MDSERMLFLYDFLNRRTNAEKGVTIEEIQRYLAEERTWSGSPPPPSGGIWSE